MSLIWWCLLVCIDYICNIISCKEIMEWSPIGIRSLQLVLIGSLRLLLIQWCREAILQNNYFGVKRNSLVVEDQLHNHRVLQFNILFASSIKWLINLFIFRKQKADLMLTLQEEILLEELAKLELFQVTLVYVPLDFNALLWLRNIKFITTGNQKIIESIPKREKMPIKSTIENIEMGKTSSSNKPIKYPNFFYFLRNNFNFFYGS